ncbi:MAG: hypothetical protein EGR97_10860 [Clostridiales bacterium]|nr:hypothetical protein [Clostridiales bacterium]
MSWKDRAQYILEKNNYIPAKQFKITQEKNRSSTAKTETASEADAHYEDALRKQYGSWSSGKLRELIGKNEAEINTTQNLALAKGLERQNTVLRKLLPEREALEERSKNVEKQQRYEASSEFQERKHYENALSKQYGNLSPSQLREKIEDNERQIAGAQNPSAAKGFANQNTYLTRILNEAEKKKKEQEKNSYYELVNKPDFQEKSKEIKKQGFFGDSKYKYINNLDGYRDKADLRSLSGGGSNDYARYAYMSNNEKDIYNYLFAVKGKKEANKFLETIEIDLDGRKQDAALKLSEKIADEHPVLSSIGTVAAAPARGIAGAASVVEDVINVATGNELNPYSDAHNVGAVTNSMRQTVSDKIAATGGKELPFVGNWKVFLYNAGMSAADSAIDILVTRGALSAAKVPAASKLAQKVTSNFVSGLMVSDAAANAIVENKEKGYSDLKSLGLGIASGAVEMLTEKFSIDNIIKEPKTFLKSLGKSFAAEGSEEVASDILNTAIDVVFNGSNSEISGKINEYIKNGDSKKEAAVKAVADTLIPSFLAGGLSGMAMGTAYHGVNSARQSAAYADIGKEVRGAQETVLKTGLKQPKDSAAYKYAEKLSAKDNVSNYDLGKQAVLNSRADFAKTDVLKELGLGNEEVRAAEGVQAAAGALRAKGERDSGEKAIRAVKNSVLHGIAKNAASIVGDKGDTKPLMKSNAEFISDKDNLITPEYIHDYAEFFTQSLEAISSPTYERLQDKTKDLTGELVRFATGASVSPELAGDADFVAVSEPFQGKLNGAIRTSQALHNLIYGENAALDAQITQYTSGNKSVIENPISSAQNSDYIAQTANSDIKFSIDEDFEANYDKWVKNGRRNDISLTVGRTSEALKSIGIEDKNITFDSGKINKILKKHVDMSDDVIKQIPTLLENPVIIMKSLQSESRVTVLGEVYDKNRKPVLAALELKPENRGNIVLDEIKIASTYGKDNVQSLMNRSDILYIDPNKNRTDNWLAHNRLQLPLGQLGYGSIKSITYPDGNVNSYSMQNGGNDVADVQKFSIDESFEANYDAWTENGRPDRQVITVGKTSEALKSIGVKNQTITWDTSKINKSLKKHRYLNDSIMKQIPDILENPIIVMQSKQSDSRITMFGEVYDGDGLPVMAVLELLPTNREGTVVLDEIKIVSTHSRKTGKSTSDMSQTQNLINNSEILYLDPNKNRTDSWFTSNRLQLPLDVTNYGPIKRITYPEGNVNSYSMQNGEKYVSESEENNERERGLLSNGIRGRQDGESSQKRAEGVAERSGADKEGREALRERRKFAQTLKVAGAVTLKTQNGVRAHFVDKSHYNSEMQQISDENAKLGVQTEFIIGGAAIPFTSGKRARGVFDRSTNTVIIQYDHARFSPEQINRHELVHKDYRSNRVQKVKNIILNSLSVSKRNSIKQKLMRDYNGMVENNEDAVFEEFICNVLAGMNEYSVEFAYLADAYWSGGELVDRYRPAEYTESMDSGGVMPQEIQYSAQSVYPSWVYDVLEGAELQKLESALMDIRIGNDGRFVRTRNGEYIVQTDNKLIYTNGDYDNPRVSKVIEFNDNYETNIDDARRMIYGAEKRGEARYRSTLQAIKDAYGEGFLYVRTDSTNAGVAGTGEGENSRKTTRNRSKQSRRAERNRSIIEAARRGISFDDDGKPNIQFSLDEDSDYIFQNLETQEEYDKALKQLLERYGSVPKGENPSRDISVPKKIAKDRPVSQFARTMMEAGVTPDEAVSEFERMILDGTMTHEIISNKSAKQRAKERVDYLGFDDAMKEWNALVDNGKVDKNGMALGMLLYNTCITNKDIKNAMKLAADLVSEASKAGQMLQATRMLKTMSPDGRLYYIEKSVKHFNDELKEKLGKRFQKDIEIDEELAKQFLEAKTEDERNDAYDALCQNIADQLPSTWRDKLDSWRYLAMLGNPRTHIRNFVGNAVFFPVVRIKNYIAAGLEAAGGVARQDRTKSVFKSKGAKAFAKRDSISMQKELQGQNAKYAITDDINSKRTIYQSKAFSWLELLRKKNFDFLEKEDWWFLKSHYEDALARVITARKIQPEFLESGTKEANELLARIRNLAVKEAQAATYRDANAVAEAFSQIKHRTRNSSSGAARLAGDLLEGVMPFTKTPSNILKQGVLYSPVGLLQGIYKTCSDVKNNKRASTDALNSLARGLTGTGILLLGMLLKSMGLIRGREDDDSKKSAFDTLIGDQSYALVFGDKTYTIDWMAPLSLPLFIGVEIASTAEKKEWGFRDVVDAVVKISDPMLELSVLQGLSSTVNSAKYSQNDALTAITANMVTSYLGQFFPTLGGQAARMIDNKRRLNYTDKESWVPGALQRFVNQTAAKIPFASKFLQVKVDNWGRELDYGGAVERLLENSVSPGYYSEKHYTGVDKELEKLYERTKEGAVLPSAPQKSITQDKVTYHLNAYQYTEFSKLRGRKAFEYTAKTISSYRYKNADDDKKVKLIKECYENAQKDAKEELFKRGILKKGA